MSQKDRLLSIIITVYNGERFLQECISSVRNQTYKNLDIIIVNDGSTDGTKDIIEKHIKIDRRIRYIEQDNLGQVVAKKTGVGYAKGDYVTFLDADDWLDPDYYDEMCKHAVKSRADIVTSGIIWEFPNKVSFNQMDSFECGIYDKESIKQEIVPQLMYSWRTGRQGIITGTTIKFFQRELLIEEQENLDDRITIGEDAALVYPAIMDASLVEVTEVCGYHYRQHDSSMVHKVDGKSFDKINIMINYLEKEFQKRGYGKQFSTQRDEFLSPFICALSNRMFGIEFGEKQFIPPYYLFPINSKIAIYGGGVIGRCFYRAFRENKYYQLAGWFDKAFRELSEFLPILSPDKIRDINFDYIIIAIENREVALEVKEELKSEICAEKIIWYQYEKY